MANAPMIGLMCIGADVMIGKRRTQCMLTAREWTRYRIATHETVQSGEESS
jgi:hypothetical protein